MLMGLLSSSLTAPHFPLWRRKAEVAFTELLPQKKKQYLHGHDSISQPLPAQTAKEKPAVSFLHSFLVAPDIFQANNIFVQRWKRASPSPPLKFVLANKARFLHTCQTPTTEKNGAEDRGRFGRDPVTGKWDGRGRDASRCATF